MKFLQRQAVNGKIAEPTLDAALNYAAYMHSAWMLSSNSANAAVTTTTMKPTKG